MNRIVDNNEKIFNKQLGNLIRAKRLIYGFTLKIMADKIGVSYQQIQKYEIGNNAISSYKLNKIFDVLNLSFDDLN